MTEANKSKLEMGKRYFLNGASAIYVGGELQDFSDREISSYLFLSGGTPESPNAEAVTKYNLKGNLSIYENGAINLEKAVLTRELIFKADNEERYTLLSIELEVLDKEKMEPEK